MWGIIHGLLATPQNTIMQGFKHGGAYNIFMFMKMLLGGALYFMFENHVRS